MISMKPLTTEQFNALPEERRKYWEEIRTPTGEDGVAVEYEQLTINLEDAERVLEEAMEKIEKQRVKNGVNITKRTLAEAINNLKQLTK